MATNVATLTAKLVADTKGLRQGLGKAEKDIRGFEQTTTKATKKGAKGFGGMKTAALGFGAALGAGAVLSFAKSSINAFSDLEESINAINVQYGEAADGVHALGQNSAEQFGLSTRAVNDAAVSLSAFAEKIDAADPAGAFGNVLQRATDFASVMNLETNVALDKFRAGLAGESEPLRQFGIDVSGAKIEAVALAAGIIEVGDKMDEGQKVQARYLAIMEQTEKTAGDFAATSDGLAGSQKKLTAKWEEAQVKLGKKLAPAFQKVIEGAVKLIPLLGPVGDLVGVIVDQVVSAVEVVEDLVAIADSLGISFGGVEGSARSMEGELGEFIGASVTIKGLWEKFDEKLWKAPWTAQEEAVKNDVAEIQRFKDKIDAVDPAVDAFGEGITELGDDFEEQGEAAKFSAAQLEAMSKSSKALRVEQLKLADPVFAAMQAIKEYEEALEAANEDQVITAEELLELGPAFAEAESASAALTGENARAFLNLIREVGLDVGAFPGVVQAAMTEAADTVGNSNVFSEIDKFFDREMRFAFDINAPSAAEIDQAIQDAIDRARGRGDFDFT